jgi:hypothetical protein
MYLPKWEAEMHNVSIQAELQDDTSPGNEGTPA